MTKASEMHAARMRSRPTTNPPLRLPAMVQGLVFAASAKFSISPMLIRDPSQRTASITAARREIIHKLNGMGFSLNQIGRWLGGMDHTSVAYLLKTRRKVRLDDLGPCPFPDLSGEWAI